MTDAPLWRLRNSHYLNIIHADGTQNEWEHTETNRETGRRGRQVFIVPALLNPNEPGDCTREGDCFVYRLSDDTTRPREANHRGYFQFLGDPTPDMEPMNAEAEAISETFATKWQHPIESLDGNFSQSLLTGLEAALASAITKAGGIPTAATSLPAIEDNRMAQLEEQVAKLSAMLAERAVPIEPTPTAVRRS